MFSLILVLITALAVASVTGIIESDFLDTVLAVVFVILLVYLLVISGGTIAGLGNLYWAAWAVVILAFAASYEVLLEWLTDVIAFVVELITEVATAVAGAVVTALSNSLGLKNIFALSVVAFIGYKWYTSGDDEEDMTVSDEKQIDSGGEFV